jgi:hypothetical protein
MFPLNISIEFIIPILHQNQVLKAIEKCGEFTQPSQMAGARKRSMPEEFKESASGERYSSKNWVDHIEYETYYPRLMLEQRMNRNIQFRVSDRLVLVDEWDSDLNSQIEMLTAVSDGEKDRLMQQSQYFIQNKNLFEIQANRDDSILEDGIQASVASKNISII